ncbi:quinone oxidoreductase [Methylocapsa sp. D3K7]|uniref:quinone oxidoreductase family protein n=1 Tax=Methylocapsa sp. D3K7 TaxID=3041435 RepID=UPI00244E6874|nr:quinone oxidoreductase [Methylocapsa sp. D3K7]WGJ15350.1 quinone oxidoreductase [Methylocapsa sp. D3K7]
MTKTIRVHETGGPEVMRIEDIELPSPLRGQVRVRHHAIGVNFIDIYFRSGVYPVPSLPFTPGNEGAGEIVALGAGVKDFKLGDRVAYVSTLGAYAGERLIAADRLVKLPKSISYETAAAMMLKGLTAQYLLRQTFKVKPGNTVLIQAAAGGVGLILCQWAKALGATVIGTVGSPEKAKLAKKAGAKHVILYREEDFAARVKEITKGKLCDVVYDGVGKATFPAALDCLRPYGLFVSFGSASGQIEAFNLGLLSTKGSLYATRPSLHTYSAKREDLEKMAHDLFRVVSSGAVKIPLHRTWPLEDVVDVHRALENRETTGATVLIP